MDERVQCAQLLHLMGEEAIKCHKINHYANFCRSRRSINAILVDDTYFDINNINTVQNKSCEMMLDVNYENIYCKLKLKTDSAECVNLIALFELQRIKFNLIMISETNDKLVTYSQQKIPILGVCQLNVKFNDKVVSAKFYVDKEPRKCILGLDTIL